MASKQRGRILTVCVLVAVAAVTSLPTVPMWIQVGARLVMLVGISLVLAPWEERTRARLRKCRRV